MPDVRAKLTILGCSPSWQNVGQACSSYVVDVGQTRLLIDCGNGAFGRLREHGDYLDVDAIVITHTHGDHVLDLVPFAYALLYSPRALRGESRRPLLYLPPGATERLTQIFGLIDRPELLGLAFDVHEYDPAAPTIVGPLELSFVEVPHFVPTYAVSVRRTGGGRFVFGADHRPSETVVEFARGADILMLEATLTVPEKGVRGHLTANEAAMLAKNAGVGELVLTHMTDELPRDQLVAGAREVHPSTTLAQPGDTYLF